MARTEHERAVREAERTGEILRTLFGRLGTRDHPRGRILSAYRQARRALKGSLHPEGSRQGQARNPAAAQEILAELRVTVQEVAQATLWAAAQQGTLQAQRQIELYGLPLSLDGYMPTSELDAWLATMDAQRAAVLGILAGGGDMAMVLGDEHRVGLLSPAPVIREGARWLAIAALTGLTVATAASVDRAQAQDDFGKQAVAAIDERTTDCCLRVNGQVQPMTERFVLTGTPRYADKMESPPFHWFCRSATALVRMEDRNDALSREMRRAAIDEQNARVVTGERVEIHPASATSRR